MVLINEKGEKYSKLNIDWEKVCDKGIFGYTYLLIGLTNHTLKQAELDFSRLGNFDSREIKTTIYAGTNKNEDKLDCLVEVNLCGNKGLLVINPDNQEKPYKDVFVKAFSKYISPSFYRVVSATFISYNRLKKKDNYNPLIEDRLVQLWRKEDLEEILNNTY